MSNSDQAAQCDNVDEADPGHNIVEGPPAAGCVEDGERWAISCYLPLRIDIRTKTQHMEHYLSSCGTQIDIIAWYISDSVCAVN